MERNNKTGMIWTLDRICEWNCRFCCVDAFSVRKSGSDLTIDSNKFKHREPSPPPPEDIFQRARQVLHDKGLALSLNDKMQILENLRGMNVEIGFSGGDLLLVRENLQVVKKASQMFGRENIGLTATGVGMTRGQVVNYLDHIGQLEFTYDSVDNIDINHQQEGYSQSNLAGFRKIIDQCKLKGVVTQALVPISCTNNEADVIEKLYLTLMRVGVDKLYLMRTFPVGRAYPDQSETLSANDYRRVIGKYRQLESQHQGPEVNVMCALKGLFPETGKDPCTFLKSTIDITSTGQLIADAFAYDLQGEPMLPELVFGNLRQNHLEELISRDHFRQLSKRVGENPGHCKIFAYLSDRSAGIDGFFSKQDPLYVDEK